MCLLKGQSVSTEVLCRMQLIKNREEKKIEKK